MIDVSLFLTPKRILKRRLCWYPPIVCASGDIDCANDLDAGSIAIQEW